MKSKTALKFGASIAAVGLVVTAMTGAFGAWTDSQTYQQTVTAGVVDIADGAGSNLTTSFGPFAPSDSGFRLVTLTNTNTNALNLSDLKVWASFGEVTDSFATAATAAQLAGAINITVKRCTVAYTAGACSGGTETTVVTQGLLSSMDTVGETKTIGDGTMAAGATHFYKVEYAVVAEPVADVQGASAPITWTFTAAPRAAITNA